MATLLTGISYIVSTEARIRDELRGKELWGDIDFLLEDYEKLREAASNKILANDLSIKEFADMYPVALTTLMVFLVRYKYNTNFWSLLGKELSFKINENHHSILGGCAKATFKKYGFDYSDCEGDHWTNLSPIFYEAGIPESSFNDLFYILSYDSHSVFDPQLIIDDLLEKRSYQIRKPLEKFLTRFKNDRAIEFVVDVHEAMLCVDQHMSSSCTYIHNYEAWKEQQKSKEAIQARKKQEAQVKPYICFDNAGRGLSIVLPRVIMKDEWVETVYWYITDATDTKIKKQLMVSGDEGSRFVPSITVSVSPASSYTITMTDADLLEDEDLLSWEINGIPEDSVALFNANGRMINASYLSYPFEIMILGENAEITGSHHVGITNQVYPTSRPEYRIVAIEPEGPGASISYIHSGIEATLRAKPQLELSFIGATLFSLPAEECSLFTEIPRLRMSADYEYDLSGLEIRVNGRCMPVEEYFEDGSVTVSLEELCPDGFSKYGTYIVKLYQNNSFCKQAEFSLVPAVRTDYTPKLLWGDAKCFFQKKLLRFEKGEEYTLEFDGCVVSSDEEYYTVQCPQKAGKIAVTIKSTSDEDYFCGKAILPIRPVEFSLIDSSGTEVEQELTQRLKLGLEYFGSREHWLSLESFGEFRSCNYIVLLRTANGIEHKEPISLTRNGCANFNLSVFCDTLASCLLPARIELCCNYDYDTAIPLLVVNDSSEFKFKPQYRATGKIIISIDDADKNLTLKRFGLKKEEISLPASISYTNEQGNGKVYPLQNKLEEGFYVIECGRSTNIFEFEDEETVTPTNNKNTIYISTRKLGDPVRSFSDWLDELLQLIIKAGKNKNLTELAEYNKLPELTSLMSKTITSSDYEKLVALAYLAADTKLLVKKDRILEEMKNISSMSATANSTNLRRQRSPAHHLQTDRFLRLRSPLRRAQALRRLPRRDL